MSTKQQMDQIIQTVINNQKSKGYEKSYSVCFLNFQRNRYNLLDDLNQNCLNIKEYLMDYGMLRKGFLKNQHSSIYKPLIIFFDSIKGGIVWDADIEDYQNEQVLQEFVNVYNGIERCLQEMKNDYDWTPSITLVTKIMMGVLGCVPAFDRYVIYYLKKLYGKQFKGEFNIQTLKLVYDLYKQNEQEFIEASSQLSYIDFEDNVVSDIPFRVVKMIDNYCFYMGKSISQ